MFLMTPSKDMKENFQTTSANGKNKKISAFKSRKTILMEINYSMSFSAMTFLNVNIHQIF